MLTGKPLTESQIVGWGPIPRTILGETPRKIFVVVVPIMKDDIKNSSGIRFCLLAFVTYQKNSRAKKPDIMRCAKNPAKL
jgi:hypothetical protein